jgi:hypothetical protein
VRINLATQAPYRLVAFFAKSSGLENRLREDAPFLSFVGKSRLRLARCVGKIFCLDLN